MAIDITAETLIVRPRGEVAVYVIDPANDTEWIGGVVESRKLTDGEMAVGSRVARTARFLGRDIHYTTEVIALDEGKRVSMTADKPFPMEITYEFEDSDGGTLTRVRVQGEGSGFFRVASPLLAPMVRRNVSGDLQRLKAQLER